MKIEFKKSFYHTFKRYTQKEQIKIYKSIQFLVESIERHRIPHGLGLKLLRRKSWIWEARVSSSIKIIFRFRENLLEFALVGSHDETGRYLKGNN